MIRPGFGLRLVSSLIWQLDSVAIKLITINVLFTRSTTTTLNDDNDDDDNDHNDYTMMRVMMLATLAQSCASSRSRADSPTRREVAPSYERTNRSLLCCVETKHRLVDNAICQSIVNKSLDASDASRNTRCFLDFDQR